MRRALVMFLSVVVLLGSLLVGGGTLVAAQDTDFSGHPLVGTWMLDTEPENPDAFPSQVIFSAEGGYVDVDAEGVVVIGGWEPTGDTTANLTITSSDPDVGVATIRASIEVAPDGQSFTATYTFEILDPATGEWSGEIGPGTAEGTRMVVEGPGTPSMSFEDFFATFEGTPEATPAP